MQTTTDPSRATTGMFSDVRKIVAALAWPVLIGQLAVIAFSVIDTAMVAASPPRISLVGSVYISV